MTAPLDRLWEQYRALGAAQPADFEAFLVAEVERLRAVIDEFIAAEDAGSGEAEGRRRYDAWDAAGAAARADQERMLRQYLTPDRAVRKPKTPALSA